MPELVIRSNDGTQTIMPLADRPIVVGRSETCDIVLRNDGEVSREHAEIRLSDDNRLIVSDLNSKNGTRVDNAEVFHNGRRIARKRVYVGDHVIELRIAGVETETVVVFAPDRPDSGMGGTRFFPSSQRLELSQQRLDLLIGLAERLSGTFERKQLLTQALNACCEALKFERGLIALKTPRGEPDLPVTHNMQRDEDGTYRVSRTLINRALLDGERAVVNNPATDLPGNFTESMIRFPICSALCVPILNRGEILGVIYGDQITANEVYNERDVDFLAAIAQQVGIGLANLKMIQEQAHTEQIMAELQHARTIQRMLLPPAPLTKDRVTIEGFNEPCSAVGGDYFDFFELSEKKLGVIIADVTGHGLPAALLMANLQAAVRVAMGRDTPLPELASRINRLICRNTASDVFITATLASVVTATGEIELVNAGHPGPLLFGDSAVLFPPGNNSLPLGVDADEEFVVQRIAPPDYSDALLFFTDGLNEAACEDNGMLGLSPVMKALSALPERTTSAMIRTARSVVRSHLKGEANGDDMTFLALHLAS